MADGLSEKQQRIITFLRDFLEEHDYPPSIRDIQQAFRLLLASKLNTSQALERIRVEIKDSPEVDYLVEFIEGSERGVTK